MVTATASAHSRRSVILTPIAGSEKPLCVSRPHMHRGGDGPGDRGTHPHHGCIRRGSRWLRVQSEPGEAIPPRLTVNLRTVAAKDAIGPSVWGRLCVPCLEAAGAYGAAGSCRPGLPRMPM